MKLEGWPARNADITTNNIIQTNEGPITIVDNISEKGEPLESLILNVQYIYFARTPSFLGEKANVLAHSGSEPLNYPI